MLVQYVLVVDCVAVVTRHSGQLVEVLEADTTTAHDRQNHLNVLKMAVYLLCQFTESLEGDACKPTTVQITGRVSILVTVHHPSELWTQL